MADKGGAFQPTVRTSRMTPGSSSRFSRSSPISSIAAARSSRTASIDRPWPVRTRDFGTHCPAPPVVLFVDGVQTGW